MTKKLPPAALAPVRAILDRDGYGPLVYSDELLRRDRVNRFIPLPGRAGATVDDAVQAALVCARGRRGTGHLCPVVGWYLLARSPEPEALSKLREALDTAVVRVAGRAARGALQLPAVSSDMGDDIGERTAKTARGVRDALTRLVEAAVQGEDRREFQAVVDELFVEQGTPRRSPAAAFREVAKVIYAAAGAPLSDDDVAAIMEAASRSDDQAGLLYGLLAADESLREHTRGPAVAVTDFAYLRTLLADADPERLRETTLRIFSPQTKGMGHADLQDQGVIPHGGEACKPACDHTAWMLCFLLDPANRRMWELVQGDPHQLMEQAVLSHMK
ncbi:hypothetical protein [Streptomyces sp. NPDC056883]|uniref:hypothetical protein n=1 Tax=Streptomyces sp. NPDC056883 TaxID=3345959 RepID=UPI00367546B5